MANTPYTLPYPAELLIPHRPPMLFVRQLLERKDNIAVVDAWIDHDNVFADSEFGILPELYIEILAQATATVRGWDALVECRPPIKGFLVGLNNILYSGKLKMAQTTLIEIAKVFEFADVTIMKGILRQEDGVVLQGEIKVWEDPGGKAI